MNSTIRGWPPGRAPTPKQAWTPRSAAEIVWESLNLLAPDIRMAVIFRDIQDKSYEEIAEMMSIPIGTLKSRISRGRLQLAKTLKEKKERRHDL